MGCLCPKSNGKCISPVVRGARLIVSSAIMISPTNKFSSTKRYVALELRLAKYAKSTSLSDKLMHIKYHVSREYHRWGMKWDSCLGMSWDRTWGTYLRTWSGYLQRKEGCMRIGLLKTTGIISKYPVTKSLFIEMRECQIKESMW